MGELRPNSTGPNSIDLAAAEWLVRRDRDFSPREQDEFLQWLAADAQHGEWLARHHRTWTGFDLLEQWRPGHSSVPNPDLLARPRPPRRWIAPVFFAAAAGVAIALAIWPIAARRATIPARMASGYERRVLEDGSVIELNRGAAVDVQFTLDERRIRLISGEAQFTVNKNPLRPFVVRAGSVDVRAVGTAFDVRLDAEAVEVLVTEGRVQVNPPLASPSAAPMPLLVAGQKTIVPLAPGDLKLRVFPVSDEAMARLLDWRPKLLDFSSTPLAQVVAEFNRRNRLQLVIADSGLAQMPIIASFRSDNVEGFVRLLETTAGVRVDRSGDTLTLRRGH